MAALEIDQGGECIAIARMVRIGFLFWGAASSSFRLSKITCCRRDSTSANVVSRWKASDAKDFGSWASGHDL
jgi:hypothetical protein